MGLREVKNERVSITSLRWMQKVTVVILLCLVTGWAENEIRFTAIPDQNEQALVERFSKIATYLSKETGVNFRYVPVKSYAASVAAFKNQEVYLAWFGGLSGVKARRAVRGAKAIAQGVEDSSFVTYFIAHKSTGLTESATLSENIAGKTFTFGSKGSTSGRLMPEYYIRKAFGKSPNALFKRVGFSGDHSKTIALVQAGSYQIGAVNYKVWEKELGEGKIDTTKVTIIWKTPTYPDYNWTIHPKVDAKYGAGFIEKVQKALINLKDEELLASFPRAGFISADNSMYRPILTTGLEIGIFDE